MRITVYPGNSLQGTAIVPGDKSLSHRALLFAALAEGESRIENFLVSGVTRAMLDALSELGVQWRLENETLTVHGHGLGGLRTPERPIYCGNSAATIRMLAGALAAAGIPAILDGSAGLRRRPMNRIVDPLRRMGVPIEATGSGGTAPLVLKARPAGQKELHALDTMLPVASAQVKTSLLLAALAADGATTLHEPGPSRDHTERMLGSMGVRINTSVDAEKRIYETRLLPPDGPLTPIRIALPGDISAAAFLIVATSITPGSEVRVPDVGINPTRVGIIEALRMMGAEIEVQSPREQAGEPVGDLIIRSANLHGIEVGGPLVVRMIDEFSVFGVAAAFAQGDTVVRDASELRTKESDRISTLCQELSKIGVTVHEAPDGFLVRGGRPLGGMVESHGDHRVAMAMTVAGLAAEKPVVIHGAEMVNESFPGFTDTLRSLGASCVEEMEQPA